MQNEPLQTQFMQVGHVSDAHGIKGELYVYLNAGHADWPLVLSDSMENPILSYSLNRKQGTCAG